MKIEVQLNHYDIKVMIDGLCHVYIDRKEFVGFHSWVDDDKMAVIEYYTKSNCIRTEFDNIKKWEQVLKALNDNL
jgi:hypothetical protein